MRDLFVVVYTFRNKMLISRSRDDLTSLICVYFVTLSSPDYGRFNKTELKRIFHIKHLPSGLAKPGENKYQSL